MNPMSQTHIKEPSVFVQLALISHSYVPLAHSSISTVNRILEHDSTHVFTSADYSPEQVSPSNPGGHSQIKLPLVFTHIALDPHMDSEGSAHSLISGE